MVFFIANGMIFSVGEKKKRLQLILPAVQVPEVVGSLHDSCIVGQKRHWRRYMFTFIGLEAEEGSG